MAKAHNFNRKMTPAERERTRQLAKANETAGYKLFHSKFKVQIRAAFLYSEEDFARGVAVTGDRAKDAQAANELITVFMPIVADEDRKQPNILDFFEQQIPDFTLVSEEEMKEIYEIIQQHFVDKAQELREYVNISKEKKARITKDLERLNALASFLHTPVYTAIPKHLAPNTIDNQLRRVLDPRAAQVVPESEKQTAQEPENKIPEYDGYESKLGAFMLKRTRRWAGG